MFVNGKLRSPNKTNSMRWATVQQETAANTARIAREEVEEARARGEAPVDRKAQLREMKQGLQKTSISFGKEPIDYTTDNVEKARQCLVGFSVEEKLKQKEAAKTMKANLTQTNFCLGDVEPQYMSQNQESMMLTKDAAKFQDKRAEKAAADELKAAIKASSLHFGNERRTKSLMQSVAHEGMENILKGNTNDFAKLKQDTVELTQALRKHNFEFGNERVEYMSDSHRGYQNYGSEHYGQIVAGREKSKIIIADTRSAHFNFGLDKVEYMSDTHRAMNSIGKPTPESRATDAKNKEHAKAMKKALTTTSINLGDDSEYI